MKLPDFMNVGFPCIENVQFNYDLITIYNLLKKHTIAFSGPV